MSEPSDFMVRWTSSSTKSHVPDCTQLPPLENLPNPRFLPRRCQRVGKMGVAARTVVKIVVKTPPTGGRHSQQAAARGRDGMDQPGCSRPSPESARSEGLVGTSGTTATGSSVTSAGGIPESVTPVTDLLRDPGGKEETDHQPFQNLASIAGQEQSRVATV